MPLDTISTISAPVLKVAYQTGLSAPATVLNTAAGLAVTQVFSGSADDQFPVGNLTLSCWLKTAQSGANVPLVQFMPTGQQTPDLIVTDPTNLTLGYLGATLTSGISLGDNAWHHLALTIGSDGIEASRLTLYIDAIPVFVSQTAIAANQLGSTSGTLTIGATGPGAGLDATLSEFRLWRRARKSDEIATDFQRRVTEGSPGLVLVWALRDPASSGTISGGGAAPFVTSSLLFRQVPADAGGFVRASWEAVSGATGYDIQFASGDGDYAFSPQERRSRRPPARYSRYKSQPRLTSDELEAAMQPVPAHGGIRSR